MDPLPGGKAIYNAGKTESTDKHGAGRWTDDPSKGQSAKIYNAEGKWVGEWVAADWGYSHGGRLGRYYFSPIKTKEETEWMKPGSGDGFLVWDKNGNGIIDDNTEMMSRSMSLATNSFQNGFEKLAFYFDLDDNGVIKGAELKQLKVWVDLDGDAQTDAGELQELSEHGITEIVIPGHHKLVSTTKTQTMEQHNVTSSGGASLDSFDFEADRDAYENDLVVTRSTESSQSIETTVSAADLPRDMRSVRAKIDITTRFDHEIKDLNRRFELLGELGMAHGQGLDRYLQELKERLSAGHIPVHRKGCSWMGSKSSRKSSLTPMSPLTIAMPPSMMHISTSWMPALTSRR